MPLDFGLSLPPGPPRQRLRHWMEDIAATLDRLGGLISSIWMTDHFMWNANPTYEAWTVLSFLAARFPELTFGPMVLGQNYRNPALLAKMGATLQCLSGGRLIMGIGAGWKEDEYAAYDFEFPSPRVRVEQLEDTLEILQRMWTEPDPVTHKGKHYSVHEAACQPKPDPVPPLLVGGGGKVTTMLAVRYADLWNMPDAAWPAYSERLKYIEQHCELIGRDPKTLRPCWFGRLVVNKTAARAVAMSHGKWTPARAFVGTPDEVLEQMAPFVEAGVDLFMPEILGLDDPDVIAMLTEEVFPALQAMV